MTALQYELLAGALRFVLVPLFLFILWQTAANAWTEYRSEKSRIGDVGAQGEIMGYAALYDEWQDEDAWRPLYDDTVLGSASGCNFRIKGHGLRAKHARLYFERGRAYVERLCGESDVLLADGKTVRGRARLYEGSRLTLAEAEMIVTFLRTGGDRG